MITAATLVSATPEHVSSALEGETVLLNLRDAQYYGLEGVGARIWALLETPRRVAAIRDAIVVEYEVEPAACEADVIAFLEALRDRGLVEVLADG